MLYRMRALYHYLGVRFPPGGLFVNWHIQYEGRGVLKLLPPSQRGDFSSGHTEGFSVSSSQSRRASCLFWQPPHQAGPTMLVDPKMFYLDHPIPTRPRAVLRCKGLTFHVKVG